MVFYKIVVCEVVVSTYSTLLFIHLAVHVCSVLEASADNSHPKQVFISNLLEVGKQRSTHSHL